MKRILITGGAGFIGSHLAKRLHEEGNRVVCVDIKRLEYFKEEDVCEQFIEGDLRIPQFVDALMQGYDGQQWDEVYTLAADMGGAGYIFTGDNDSSIMHNSAMININMAYSSAKYGVGRLFYSSSACIYNQDLQKDFNNTGMEERSAWPLNPDSNYGIEKGFSEKLYKAFAKNDGLEVRIARYHNIFGEKGSWNNGKEKAPSAICRKVAEAINIYAKNNPNLASHIDIWGDGQQTRSFLYIDECVEGTIRLMRSDCKDIVNIGSEESISINDLARMAIDISGKNLAINNILGPIGVKGRNSHNALIREKLEWEPTQSLRVGMEKLYTWVEQQVAK